MTTLEKLIEALQRLYRAVLNRSKFVYPVYARQVRKWSEGYDQAVIKDAKAIAIYLITQERKAA